MLGVSFEDNLNATVPGSDTLGAYLYLFLNTPTDISKSLLYICLYLILIYI